MNFLVNPIFTVHMALWGSCKDSHFTNETETLRNEVTPSRSPTLEATEPEFSVYLSESNTKALVSEMSVFQMVFWKWGFSLPAGVVQKS